MGVERSAGQGPDNEQTISASHGLWLIAVIGLAVWILGVLADGPLGALKLSPVLVIAAGLAGWDLLMKMRLSPSRLGVTIGPWRRYVNLSELESLRWKEELGGFGAIRDATIVVRDRSGHQVPISGSRFSDFHGWEALLLHAADSSRASVDPRARAYLEKRIGRRDKPHRRSEGTRTSTGNSSYHGHER